MTPRQPETRFPCPSATHKAPLHTGGPVAARVTRPEDAWGPGRAGPVLVICSHGARSLVATTRLRRMGVAARSLTGGENALRR